MKTTQFSPPDNLVLVALPARWSDQDYELWTGDTTTQQHIITVQTSSNSPVSILARFNMNITLVTPDLPSMDWRESWEPPQANRYTEPSSLIFRNLTDCPERSVSKTNSEFKLNKYSEKSDGHSDVDSHVVKWQDGIKLSFASKWLRFNSGVE